MIYVFVDETYPNRTGHHPIHVGCVVASQDRLNTWWRALSSTPEPSAWRRLTNDPEELLRNSLGRTGGFVVLASATAVGLPASGHRYNFAEGGGVAWGDMIWEFAVGQTVAAALRVTQELRWGALGADIFLSEHNWDDSRRHTEVETLRRVCTERSRDRYGDRVSVRRVATIEDEPGRALEKFAFGARLAHWALKLPGLKTHERCFEVDLSSTLTAALEAALDDSGGRSLRARRHRRLLETATCEPLGRADQGRIGPEAR